jgi:hypothetical protein
MVTEHSKMSSITPMEIENSGEEGDCVYSGGERDNEKGNTQRDQCTTLIYVNVIAHIIVSCGGIISCMYIVGCGMQRDNSYRE